MDNTLHIEFELNGMPVSVDTEPNRRLVDLLRETLKMTSVKEGCGEGECGACTVLVNDIPVTSCTMLAGQVQGERVTTLEGLAQNGELHPLQRTFIEAGAVQCGYCTPGMILTAKSLLMHNPRPTRAEIKKAMSGNLCRCTGYAKIAQAVEMAIGRD